jgi:hypothetical protein
VFENMGLCWGAWSKAITSFAIAQAFAAYGMSFLFVRDSRLRGALPLPDSCTAAKTTGYNRHAIISLRRASKRGSIPSPYALGGPNHEFDPVALQSIFRTTRARPRIMSFVRPSWR